MDQTEQQNFDNLSIGPMVSADYVQSYFGIPWPFTGDLLEDFDRWRESLRNQAAIDNENASRYEIEGFFQSQDITTKKFMAAQLGMDEDSFDRVTVHPKLRWLSLQPHRYFIYEGTGIVANSFANDLKMSLHNLRHRTFGNFNAFCHRLHEDLRTRLTVSHITKLHCSTSEELGEATVQTAAAFDCISCKPVSTMHSEWLDFGKPLRLEPDRVSKLLYARNLEVLGPYLAGTREPDLTRYQQFIDGQAGGGTELE